MVLLNGVTVIVKAAHVRLCHSRMLFMRCYPRETQEMVFDAPMCALIKAGWLETFGVLAMATQIVMDRTGDTRHYFDAKDSQALAKAEERFKKLTGKGFTAAVRTARGEVSRIRSFDPTAEETLFFPRLVGG